MKLKLTWELMMKMEEEKNDRSFFYHEIYDSLKHQLEQSVLQLPEANALEVVLAGTNLVDAIKLYRGRTYEGILEGRLRLEYQMKSGRFEYLNKVK